MNLVNTLDLLSQLTENWASLLKFLFWEEILHLNVDFYQGMQKEKHDWAFFESVSIEIAATLTILINYYEKILKISSLTPRRINFEADVITK